MKAPTTLEFDLVFAHVRDTVLFIRVSDGRILAANPASLTLYGRTPEEMRELRIFDLLNLPEGAPDPVDATRGGQITEEGILFESLHRKRDGSLFPVEVSARVADIDGAPTVIAIVRDITERAEAQLAVKRAHVELEQVFDTAADGMRIVDRKFNVVRMNRTMEAMTGVPVEQAVGRKCYESFPGPNCRTPRCPLTQLLKGAEPLTEEVEKTTANGETISCILHARPFTIDGKVVGIIESLRDITERKQAEQLAHYLATHDTLTELPNRHLFTDRLTAELARARRELTRPALMFCDIDRFKQINDSFGHAVGDQVLQSVARAMCATVREVDSLARLGGDEFVVLLSDVKPAAAESVARKILDAVRTRSAVADGDSEITLSIGVALYRIGDDPDSLMNRADTAMYEVKARGGDDVLTAP